MYELIFVYIVSLSRCALQFKDQYVGNTCTNLWLAPVVIAFKCFLADTNLVIIGKYLQPTSTDWGQYCLMKNIRTIFSLYIHCTNPAWNIWYIAKLKIFLKKIFFISSEWNNGLYQCYWLIWVFRFDFVLLTLLESQTVVLPLNVLVWYFR